MVCKVNVTVDDVSPLINYSPREAWHNGIAGDGQRKSLVHNGTFMVTDRDGSTATFTFNGTAVWLYGSKSKSNGNYKVTLDDIPTDSAFIGNGFSDEDLFQQVLFEAKGLDGTKLHRLTVESVVTDGTTYLAIDSIVHEVEVPDGRQEFRQQHTASSVEYSPSAWSIEMGGFNGCNDYSGHTTSRGGAYVVYDFEGAIDFGSDVEISATIGPQDGGSSVTPDAKSEYLTPQTLSIDYTIVRRSPSVLTEPTPGPSPSPSPSLSGGKIGGIAVCISILLILLGAFIWYRRNRNRGDSSVGDDRDIEIPKSESPLGTGAVAHHTPSLPLLPTRTPSPYDSPMVSVSLIESAEDAETDGSLACLNVNSKTKLVLHSNHSYEGQGMSFGSSGVGAVGSPEFGHGGREMRREESGAVSPLPSPPVMMFGEDSGRRNSRQSVRPLPRPRVTSSSSLQYSASLPNLRSMRMRVEGRVQDFGPASTSFFVIPNPSPVPNHGDDDLLPPDYNQATEPFPHPMSIPAPVPMFPHSVSPPLPVHFPSLFTGGR
ncbi:hypothetical protein BDM02DRAFT_3182818 [Thelephora ganbajun]|uniref:Uncharacterized protein n=1 Tax=Thelephora ganbajun TaxID=370292 RepID=A0ACB6ZV64_THEGA|nr:hypothetical protein BDM02DRAFT_3182818 [Thelephora ganbajun]